LHNGILESGPRILGCFIVTSSIPPPSNTLSYCESSSRFPQIHGVDVSCFPPVSPCGRSPMLPRNGSGSGNRASFPFSLWLPLIYPQIVDPSCETLFTFVLFLIFENFLPWHVHFSLGVLHFFVSLTGKRGASLVVLSPWTRISEISTLVTYGLRDIQLSLIFPTWVPQLPPFFSTARLFDVNGVPWNGFHFFLF